MCVEEVLGSGGALWFSPDGNKIAIARFDDTLVEEFTYILYEDQYEREVALRYPKVRVYRVKYFFVSEKKKKIPPTNVLAWPSKSNSFLPIH